MNMDINMQKQMEKYKILFLVEFYNQLFSNDKNFVRQRELLNSKKGSFYKMINDTAKNIGEEEKFSDFLLKKKLEILFGQKRNKLLGSNRIKLFIKIKIFGTLFVTFHFIAIFMLIGLMQVLKDELFYSIKLKLFGKEKILDFYDNYNKLYMQIPEFSFFYLSSLFSDSLLNYLGFFKCNAIILIVNVLNIFIGIKSIGFHIGEQLNEAYSFNKILFILFTFIVLYLGTGIIIEYPNEKLIECFDLYDSFVKTMKRNINNNIDSSLVSIKNELNNDENSENEHNNNGLILSYIFSIIFSSISIIILNKYFVINKKEDSFYLNIILIYIITTILSFISYWLFLPSFDESGNYENDNEVESFQFFGYLFYSAKFNLDNKKDKILIIYKLKGFWSWLCGFICKGRFIFLSLLIMSLEITNIAFKSSISEFYDNNNNQYKLIIYIISYVSLIFYYFLNMLFGFFYNKKYGKNKQIDESDLLFYGLYIVIYLGSLYSAVISILVYFNVLTDNAHYFAIISNQSSEYIKMLILFIIDNTPNDELYLELISGNMLISFYLIIYSIIPTLLDLFGVKMKILLIIQFFCGVALVIALSIAIFCCNFLKLNAEQYQNLENFDPLKKQNTISKIDTLLENDNIKNENREYNDSNQLPINDYNNFD